jgi:type 1 glutamine amidotransferase
MRPASLVVLLAAILVASSTAAEPKRLLLLGQSPDGHPPATHEYMAGVRIIAKLLADTPGLETTIAKADEPWSEGPELINRTDGVVIFLSQGAKWIHADPRRLEALARLAARKGGFVGLHWGIGTKDAGEIENYLKLVGGCHGGPDRRFGVFEEASVKVADPHHPVTRGLQDFQVREELYFRLKFVPPAGSVHPLLQADIEGQPETIAWAWERPDGGRSFGFCGLHFHENWRLAEYRRLVAQGVLWSVGLPAPEEGLDVDLTDEELEVGSTE